MSYRNLFIAGVVALVFAGALGCEGPTGPKTGSLTVTIDGLPADIPATVTITTPKQTTLTAAATTTLTDLEPGTYHLAATNAGNTRSTFAPTNITTTVEIVAGKTPQQASVTYAVTTGVVLVSITGAPVGTTSAITLSSAGGQRTVNSAGEVGNLAPGTYGVTVANIDTDELYAGVANPSSVTVTPSTSAVPLAVTYSVSTGRVTLSPSGLPAGAVATWDLAGPAGFTKSVSGAGQVVVSHLPPGQFNLVSRNVLVGADTYGSSSGTTAFSIAAGQPTQVNVAYSIRPPTFDLTVAAAYLVQSTQNLSGSVPIVAGRDAYLRVFAKANESNSATPQVRARFYRNGQVVATQTIAAPRSNVPLSVSEATTTDSWGVLIPGSVLQPGTSMLVDVDPANTVREIDESDNQYPLNGSPRALDIRTVSVPNLRFVPIVTGDGSVGNVTAGRLQELVNITLRIHPLVSINADLRSPFSTSILLAQGDTNSAWVRILSQIETLRVAEGSGSQYVGVMRDKITNTWAGYGYIPGRTVVVYDESNASEVLAHELGHNWSRRHAPCGNPSGIDTSFPYANARVGVYGYDGATGRIISNDLPDLMSYCWLPIGFTFTTPRQWTSDYTYINVFNYRQAAGVVAADVVRQDCLIVWGRVTRRGLVLEPAFVANTLPVLPSRAGRMRLTAIDQSGETLMSLAFDPQQVEEGRVPEEHFAYAIPLSMVPISRLASLSVSGAGFPAQIRSARSVGVQPEVRLSSPRTGMVRFKWDADATPLLVITDAQSGQILSFATSGDAVVSTSATSFRVKASNGVRSTEMQLRR